MHIIIPTLSLLGVVPKVQIQNRSESIFMQPLHIRYRTQRVKSLFEIAFEFLCPDQNRIDNLLKVQIFLEGHKSLKKMPTLTSLSNGGDIFKFCGILTISEL